MARCQSLAPIREVSNVKTRTLVMMLLMVGVASACIKKEDKTDDNNKAALPPPPSAPPPEPARSALAIDQNAKYTLVAVGANKCLQFAGKSMDEQGLAEIAACDRSTA